MREHIDPLYDSVEELKQEIESLKNRILTLEMQCAPLYGIDIDSFFRQFLDLKMVIVSNQIIGELMKRYDAIAVPPVPPPPGTPDLLGYYKAVAQQDGFKKTASEISTLLSTSRGEIKNADNPIEVAHKWFFNMKQCLTNRGIHDVIEKSAEDVFPLAPTKEKDT